MYGGMVTTAGPRCVQVHRMMESFQDLFYRVKDLAGDDASVRFLGDVCMPAEGMLDEADYYGWDFSQPTRRMGWVFFDGHQDPVVAWIGEDDLDRIEEMPIYQFLLDLDDPGPVEPLFPNLRACLQAVVDWCRAVDFDFGGELDRLQEETRKLSTVTVDKGPYLLVLSEDT